jgi:hypothetical protein
MVLGKMAAAQIFAKWKMCVNLLSLEVTALLSVDGVYADEPFAYNGALMKQVDRKKEVLNWCPEKSLYRVLRSEIKLNFGAVGDWEPVNDINLGYMYLIFKFFLYLRIYFCPYIHLTSP